MSPLEIAAWSMAGAAAIPAWTSLRNLRRYREPGQPPLEPLAVSVLIPARNEEESIGDALRSVLASQGVELEVVVGDDDSTDRTAEIVDRMARLDPRVRRLSVPSLPEGWCGKQHACACLAESARFGTLVFIDADVRLEPHALALAAGTLASGDASLVSGFPRLVTVSWLERWLLPLIHWVLLGFLPMGRMRRSTHPAYGAGCGQLMAVRREAYARAGGHGAIRASLHDGVQLPRAFRRAGERTDLFDAASLARCRMYRDARSVWSGLGKNAVEGLGAPRTIGPATILLALGQVLPPISTLVAFAVGAASAVTMPLVAATVLVYLPRVVMARRFGHSLDSVLLHPLGVALLLTVQWQALLRSFVGGSATWKGRAYRPSVPAHSS